MLLPIIILSTHTTRLCNQYIIIEHKEVHKNIGKYDKSGPDDILQLQCMKIYNEAWQNIQPWFTSVSSNIC